MREFFEVTYRISGSPSDVQERTESILLEQTIETPAAVAVRYPFVRANMMGSIREIAPDPSGGMLAVLALPLVTASSDPAQFLNVLFGNSSLHADVELVDFRIPPALEPLFAGPQHGIDGLRRISGVASRPLTCSALKPAGARIDELTDLCRGFVAGGIDMIKDDHYLADQPFAPFENRVRSCLAAVEEMSAKSGNRTIYVPNLSGTPDVIRRQADFAQRAGAKAVMIAPMLVGMPLLHELSRKWLEIPVIAHPSFSGSTCIPSTLLLGKLFRLFGADAVIFANFGGRFSYPPSVCREIAENLRKDWMWIPRTFPVPAGGMDANRALELVRFFGLDTILLVGGSLLEAGDALTDATRAFSASVQSAAEALRNET
jgi:ribulose-bisphosphate carboxylase large chain